MTRLLFVRHGETDHNVAGKICTHTDEARLSEQGLIQARMLAARLLGVSITAVYSSPMTRAVQTASAIAERRGLSVLISEDLRELSAGELDGRSDPAAFDALNAALDAWCMGDDTVRIGQRGDVGKDVIGRLAAVTAHITSCHEGQTVVLVSHGGLLQIGLPWICSNLGPNYGLRRHIANSSVIEIESGTEIRCVAWADAWLCPDTPAVLSKDVQ